MSWGVLIVNIIASITRKAAHATCDDLLVLFYFCCVIGLLDTRISFKICTGRQIQIIVQDTGYAYVFMFGRVVVQVGINTVVSCGIRASKSDVMIWIGVVLYLLKASIYG